MEATTKTESVNTTAPVAAPTGGRDPIKFDASGKLVGIDGVLDQISGSLARQAEKTILPVLQRDKDLQRTVGKAAGKAAAKEIKPLLVVIAASLAYIAYRQWKNASYQRHQRKQFQRRELR